MIRIIATLCRLAAPTDCHDVTVAWLTITTGIETQRCQIGQPALADWMRGFPDYSLAGWKCFVGEKREGI